MKFRFQWHEAMGLGHLLLGAFVALLVNVPNVFAQVREIPVVGLPGVASVQYDRQGRQTIEYNPRTCARLGPELCEFFRAHEHGHIALNHLGRQTPIRRAEYEADVWASRHISPAARAAAIEFFAAGRGGSFVHGSGRTRAERISAAPVVSQGSQRAIRRSDGTRVIGRTYSGARSRPFDTFGARTLIRRSPPQGFRRR